MYGEVKPGWGAWARGQREMEVPSIIITSLGCLLLRASLFLFSSAPSTLRNKMDKGSIMDTGHAMAAGTCCLNWFYQTA